MQYVVGKQHKVFLSLCNSELHRSDFRLINEGIFCLLSFEVGSEFCYSVILGIIAQLFIG